MPSVMALLNRALGEKLIWFTSILGAIAHNTGQIIVAMAVLGSAYVLYYLPFLLLSGIITGLFTGLCAHYLHRRLPRF